MNLSKPIPTSFNTERFLVRRFQPGDEEALYEAARASIAEVFQFLPWCHPDYTMSDATSWLDNVIPNWKDGSAYTFGIFSEDTGEFHGGCGVNRFDEHPIANLGYWIKTASTGKGIATEATIALARFAITHIGLQRIEIIMSVNNPGSREVAIKAGAQYEGRARNRLLLHDKRHDAYVYSITPEDLSFRPEPKAERRNPSS